MKLSPSRAPCRNKLATRSNPIRGPLRFFLLVLFASFLGSIPARAGDLTLPASWQRSSFAIADFDMDGRLNLATVQTTFNSSSLSIYRVQVQLDDGRLQSIDLVGPPDGIRIAARDVNGNGFPDIVVTSASRNEPLAILLNDGRGAFSLLDPFSFPGAFSRSDSNLNGDLPSHRDIATILSQSPVGEFFESKYLSHLRPVAGSISEPNSAAFLSALLVSLPERAPPASPSV
jgi:hypothetical protein